MEVKINKEIRNYTESMFFGLSMRQFIFSVLACGVAVGLYFLLRPQFGTETLSWMCILGASPFAMMGFIKYNGMTAEQFVWAWIKSEFLIEIMPLMFIPAGVGLITSWEQLQSFMVPLLVITVVSTFVVMIVTGKVTDFLISRIGKGEKK